MNSQKTHFPVTQDKQLNRNSNSTNCTEEESQILQQVPQSNSIIFNNCHIKLLLTTNQQKVSKKINKIAVNWIQTQCMIKDANMETNILATVLYYCYVRIRKIQKCQIQPILIACVLLASKMYNGPILTVKDGLELVNTPYPTEKIIEYQQQLLNCLNYNIHFPTTFTNFSSSHPTSDFLFPRVCFLLQLLLQKECSVLFSTEIFTNLTTIASLMIEQQAKNMEMRKICKNLQNLQIKQKQGVKICQGMIIDAELVSCLCEIVSKNQDVLISKYRGMFDVDGFVKKMKKIN